MTKIQKLKRRGWRLETHSYDQYWISPYTYITYTKEQALLIERPPVVRKEQ